MKILIEYDIEVDGVCKDPVEEFFVNLPLAGVITDEFAILVNEVTLKESKVKKKKA